MGATFARWLIFDHIQVQVDNLHDKQIINLLCLVCVLRSARSRRRGWCCVGSRSRSVGRCDAPPRWWLVGSTAAGSSPSLRSTPDGSNITISLLVTQINGNIRLITLAVCGTRARTGLGPRTMQGNRCWPRLFSGAVWKILHKTTQPNRPHLCPVPEITSVIKPWDTTRYSRFWWTKFLRANEILWTR